ncbi:hypothetical protein KCP74_05610 [Salmonella enterica subsp. enterica]|nr:hypothetical protein KCP74_05610 [Salmonella enterica subsp. enterica]
MAILQPDLSTRAALPNAIKSPEWREAYDNGAGAALPAGSIMRLPACISILFRAARYSRSRAWAFTITRARSCSTL